MILMIMLIEYLIIWVKLVLNKHQHHRYLKLKLIKLILLLNQSYQQIHRTKRSNHFHVLFVHILLEISMNFKYILQNIQKKIFDVYYAIACNYLNILFIILYYSILFKGINIDEIVLHI
jgi:hypothetical protein